MYTNTVKPDNGNQFISLESLHNTKQPRGTYKISCNKLCKNVSLFLEKRKGKKGTGKAFTSRSFLINVANALQILLRLCFAQFITRYFICTTRLFCIM